MVVGGSKKENGECDGDRWGPVKITNDLFLRCLGI